MSGKLKILCLHGYTQNAIMFRKKIAAACKSVQEIAEFTFVTGPHHIIPATLTTVAEREEVANEYVSEGKFWSEHYYNYCENTATIVDSFIQFAIEHKPYGWWFSPKYKPIDKDGFFIGFKESVDFIKDIMIKEGPFDGILGFSQGACFTALLTQLLEDRSYFPDLISPSFEHPPLKFSIIVAGFKPVLQEATNVMLTRDKKVKTPSMHFIGDLDTLVSPENMVSLTEAFDNPTIFRHMGGHYLPSNSTSCKAFHKFLSSFV